MVTPLSGDDLKRDFVLLRRRWIVERPFALLARFRRLPRDYERLPSPLAGLHWLNFQCLLINKLLKDRHLVYNGLELTKHLSR